MAENMDRGLRPTGFGWTHRDPGVAGAEPGAGLVPASIADRGWSVCAVSGLGHFPALEEVHS